MVILFPALFLDPLPAVSYVSLYEQQTLEEIMVPHMQHPVKRIAAIHDLSGFGRASLTVVIPILSTMGIQVCPLPTAVLSTHSKFPDYTFVDLTQHLPAILHHWRSLDIRFDALYSGFLGSDQQIEIVADLIDQTASQNPLVVVDPVLGDDGNLYGPFDSDMVIKMRSLIHKASVITPNCTEAAFLLDQPCSPEISETRVRDWLYQLSDAGPECVIVTSVPVPHHPHKTSVMAYDRRDQRTWKVKCDYLPASYPGTGDAFTSVIVGSLLQGDSLPLALDRAVQFISAGVRATFGYRYHPEEGILLERVLDLLRSSVPVSSYELID
jgi:pyridoxine kinase